MNEVHRKLLLLDAGSSCLPCMIICITYVLTFKRHVRIEKSNTKGLCYNVLSTEFNYMPGNWALILIGQNGLFWGCLEKDENVRKTSRIMA